MTEKVVAKKLTVGDVVGEMTLQMEEMRSELDELWAQLDGIKASMPQSAVAAGFVYPVRAEVEAGV